MSLSITSSLFTFSWLFGSHDGSENGLCFSSFFYLENMGKTSFQLCAVVVLLALLSVDDDDGATRLISILNKLSEEREKNNCC